MIAFEQTIKSALVHNESYGSSVFGADLDLVDKSPEEGRRWAGEEKKKNANYDSSSLFT